MTDTAQRGRPWPLEQDRRRTTTLLLFVLSAAMFAGSASAAELDEGLGDLTLEQLMDIEVTSVSKKAQKLSRTASAVYVLTGEDIRRSGARSIPDALRLVPGLQVARIDGNTWAVSSRGFNGIYANKLLVLIDGRSVYSPFFSGVHWEQLSPMLEDIERIEVIRGPGGTVWGANAVNGVINIISKSARDTQGGVLTVGAGSEERGFGSLRYGGKLGDDAWYRVYTKYLNRDGGVDQFGHAGPDDRYLLQGGFRLDLDLSDSDTLTFQGDYFGGSSGQGTSIATYSAPFTRSFDYTRDITGGNFLTRWTHEIDDESDLALQFYYDRTAQKQSVFREIRETYDIDFQHRFRPNERHEIVWGAGYRLKTDDFNSSDIFSITPGSRTDDVWSAFIQDEITLVPERLFFTVGSKVECNDSTGIEYQPSARMVWTPSPNHAVWATVSRAVKTPSRAGEGLGVTLPVGGGTFVRVIGNTDLESENLLSYELGYRVQATQKLSFDVAAFYNRYDGLITNEPGTPFVEALPAPAHLIIPVLFDNRMDAETYGVELAADLTATDWWRLRGGYTYLQMHLHPNGNSGDTDPKRAEGESPSNQVFIRSSMQLPRNIEFDVSARYVDSIHRRSVGGYSSVDARLSWRPTKTLELFITGRNLLQSEHKEYESKFGEFDYTEAPRGFYAGATWRF